MNSLPSQKRVWRRSIKYCLWIYVRYSLLHMRWQYTAKVKTARIPTEESLISVLPAIWWVNRAVKDMQLPKEVSIHWRMRWLYRLQSGTSRSTPSLRAGFRHTIMNNYGQKTIHNILRTGWQTGRYCPYVPIPMSRRKRLHQWRKHHHWRRHDQKDDLSGIALL